MASAGRLCLVIALAAGGCNVEQRVDGPPADSVRAPGPVPGAVAEVDPMVVGDRLLAADEPALALESYLRAARLRGLTPGVRRSMAAANIDLGRLRQAERLLRGVVAETPRDAAAINDLGVVLMQLGETGEAHNLFRAAFALQPTPEIRGNLLVSGATLERRVYDDVARGDFTLTRRAGGVYALSAPAAP